MKSALVVLPCLLALAHLVAAQGGVCTEIQNLSTECRTALASPGAALCSGSCLAAVLSAYERCGGSSAEAAAQLVREQCARNSNGDFCISQSIVSASAEAVTACGLGSSGGGSQCSNNCRTALQELGCCANSAFLGTNTFVSTCGISTEKCAPATVTGGSSALHSVVGVLTSLIFAGLAMIF